MEWWCLLHSYLEGMGCRDMDTCTVVFQSLTLWSCDTKALCHLSRASPFFFLFPTFLLFSVWMSHLTCNTFIRNCSAIENRNKYAEILI